MSVRTTGLIFDLIARDNASAAILRVGVAADKTATSTSRMDSALAKVRGSMDSAGKKLTSSVTTPVLAAAAASVYMATKYETAMTNIRTQAGASAKDVRTLSTEVLNLSKSTQQGPVQLADALFHLKSVGLDNVNAMRALRTASDLAAVGHANLEDTTNALAGAWRTGIKGAQNFNQAAATILATVGAGNMKISDFVAAIGTGILPTAKTFGLSMKDVGAALALMTDEGVPADEAATRLRMTFSLLGAPSEKATKALTAVGLGADDAKGRVTAMDTLLAKAGVTTTTLASDMRKPDGLLVAVQDLKTHLDNSHVSLSTEAALLSKAFGGGKSSATMLSLINNAGVLSQKYTQLTKNTANYNAAVAAEKATPQAQFANLGSNLERLSIILGTKLLPVAIDGVKDITGLVTSFDSLSHTDKELLAWGVGITAALGPVLAIGSRLTTVIAGLWNAGASSARFIAGMSSAELSVSSMQTRSYTAGLSMTRNFQGIGASSGIMAGTVGRSMRMAGAAFGGAAIGYGLSQLTQNASTADQMLGALGSTALGAAQGFAVGGPWGAAIGAGAGLISNLASDLLGAGNAAEQAVKPTNDYTTALMNNSKAAATNLKQMVASDLQKSGAFTAGAKLGIDPSTIENAVLGNKADRSQISATLNNPYNKVLNDAYGLSAAQVKANNQRVAALKTLGDAVGYVTDKVKVNKTAADQENAALSTSTKRQNAYTAALKSITAAQATAASSLSKLTTQAAVHGTSLTGSSANATSNITLMDQILTKYQAIAKQQVLAGVSAQTVNATYDHGTASLLAQAKAAGFNTDAVQAMIKQYDLTPKQMLTYFLANTSKASADVSSLQGMINDVQQNKIPGLSADSTQGRDVVTTLQEMIDHLTGKTVPVGANTATAMQNLAIFQAALNALHDKTVSVSVHQIAYNDTSGAGATTYEGITPAGGKPKPHAAGGSVADGWFTTGEQGGNPRSWELMHKSGSNLQVYSNSQARKMTGWDHVPGYAGGSGSKVDASGLSSSVESAISGVGLKRPSFSAALIRVAALG